MEATAYVQDRQLKEGMSTEGVHNDNCEVAGLIPLQSQSQCTTTVKIVSIFQVKYCFNT